MIQCDLACPQYDELAVSAAGKDVFWYTREKQAEQEAKARLELQAIKQREEDLMNEVGEHVAMSEPSSSSLCMPEPCSLCMLVKSCRHLGLGSQAQNSQARRKAQARPTRHGQAARQNRLRRARTARPQSRS